MKANSYVPNKKFLHGPGPSNVHPRVLQAMANPTIGHLDPEFISFMEEVKDLLKLTFQTNNRLTFPVSGPGSLGMETCLANLIAPDDRVVICVNGVFGQRMVENVKRIGGIPIVLQVQWGKAIDPHLLQEFLQQQITDDPIKAVAFVHAETSTGALSDAKSLCEIIHNFKCLSIVDAVTSVAGLPVKVDEWKVDAIYSGTQKCLSCPPGLSPVSFSENALNIVNSRKTPVQSWFMDISLVQSYWNQSGGNARTYHHTAPVNLLYALHESLVMYHQEGQEAVWKRHQDNALLLKIGLQKLGFEYLVPEESQMPQLHVVIPPKNLIETEAKIRASLLRDYKIEIGGGLGELSGKVWRIGLMGHSSHKENIKHVIESLEMID